MTTDENKKLVMECGHTANGESLDGEPVCAICMCTDIDENIKVDLHGRKAKCSECGKIVDSKFGLPFFQYRGDEEYDSYYCGCEGWD